VSIGAPGRITQLDDSLPWWLGTADFEERFGIPIDLPALRRVPVQMVVGSQDTETWEINNVGGPNWMDGVEKTGRTRLERIETLRRNFEERGIEVRFDVVPGAAHRGTEVIPAVQALANSHGSATSPHGLTVPLACALCPSKLLQRQRSTPWCPHTSLSCDVLTGLAGVNTGLLPAPHAAAVPDVVPATVPGADPASRAAAKPDSRTTTVDAAIVGPQHSASICTKLRECIPHSGWRMGDGFRCHLSRYR
jgi:hypothetical protein